MVHEVLFQPLLSIVASLIAFLLMAWPGYALLHVMGHGRHRWSGALFAGPGFTLVLWIVTLSGSAWASIPLRLIFGPFWILTLALAALGVFLHISVRAQVVKTQSEDRHWNWLLWLLAAVVPLLIMPATFRYGLGTFVNSTYPDPWSYAMVADYLSAVPRGAEGGLSSLHQYASHLMNTRNASSAILAYLAAGLGDIKTDQVMTPFCLLVLFANASALIAFARTIFGRDDLSACFALLAGLGWPANIVFAGNFDQLLLLPLLPLVGALAQKAHGSKNGSKLWSASVLIGALAAAALFAYVELAFLGILVALSFVIPPGASLRMTIVRVAMVGCIAAPVMIVLTWPGSDALLRMLTSQFALANGAVRPGEGLFSGLILPLHLPSAVSSMGGEFPHMRWSGFAWIIGTLLCGVTLVGVWHERRRWPVIFAFILIAIAFVHFAYRENYSYGAYKIVSVNVWMLGFFTITGALAMAASIAQRLPRRITVASVAAIVVLLTVIDRTFVQAQLIDYRNNARQQQGYREALVIPGMTGNLPTLLSVRDGVANEWSVFYLSNPQVMIAPYRRYMAQAHVIPFMERAQTPDAAAIRFVVTDRNDLIRAPLWGAQRVWDGSAYSLWKIDHANWAIIVDAGDPNAPQTGGLWLGSPKTEFVTVTARSGPAVFTAMVKPGPKTDPGTTRYDAVLEDAAGRHEIVLQTGENRVPINLPSGRGLFSLSIQGTHSASPPDSEGVQTSILHLTDYGIQRGG